MKLTIKRRMKTWHVKDVLYSAKVNDTDIIILDCTT